MPERIHAPPRGAECPAGRGKVSDVYAATLQRAAEVLGGEQELALRLKATPSHVALWLRGEEQPPTHIFLKVVDLLSSYDLPKTD
jgi:hypothetical protein